MKYVTISVSKEIKNRLKSKCATENKDIKTVTEELIIKYLEESKHAIRKEEGI